MGWGNVYSTRRFKNELNIIDSHFKLFETNKYRKIATNLITEAKGMINKYDTLDKRKLTNNNVWYYDFFRNILSLRSS